MSEKSRGPVNGARAYPRNVREAWLWLRGGFVNEWLAADRANAPMSKPTEDYIEITPTEDGARIALTADAKAAIGRNNERWRVDRLPVATVGGATVVYRVVDGTVLLGSGVNTGALVAGLGQIFTPTAATKIYLRATIGTEGATAVELVIAETWWPTFGDVFAVETPADPFSPQTFAYLPVASFAAGQYDLVVRKYLRDDVQVVDGIAGGRAVKMLATSQGAV